MKFKIYRLLIKVIFRICRFNGNSTEYKKIPPLRTSIILLLCGMVFFNSSLVFAQGDGSSFDGFNLQGYDDNGKRLWDVKGDTANVIGTEIKIHNVDANTYGEEPMNVTAEIGRIDKTSGKMHLEKDVVVTSEEGVQLMTDTLGWHKDKDLLFTQDDILITHESFSAMGVGMETNPGLKKAKILEDVTVMIDTEPEGKERKFITITSDGPMVMDQARGIAVFHNNVIAIQEDRMLKADLMEVFFSLDAKTIKKMICTGHVIIIQEENQAFAQKAIYEGATKKLTLLGRAKLIVLAEEDDGASISGN